MTMDLALCRQFFAEEITAVSNLRTPELVDALRSVPREQFLRPGPWLVRGEGDFGGARSTPDSDVRHVYHNYSIAIEPQRQLFNGAPGVVAPSIDALGLRRGAHVLHVGAGLGYYTALMAHVVGADGRVVGIEIDPDLASEARANLASTRGVSLQLGDATAPLDGAFDAILVSAGVTHPQPTWLDALKPGGRLILPLTATMDAMGPIGKGVTVLFTRQIGDRFPARVLNLTVIYSGVGLRDETLNRQLGQALMGSPFPRFTTLRIDAHPQGSSCWFHSGRFCLSNDAGVG